MTEGKTLVPQTFTDAEPLCHASPIECSLRSVFPPCTLKLCKPMEIQTPPTGGGLVIL